ncbi:hypothetical protein HOL63_02525 [Candidatus Peregrinibacteria bacterium]|jgi:hypothetical protein|nr:hypothetical protein [Candidatus Peregrinibacteria bacterium]MBT5468609.1 hypothetical protein [Candidatus Peregrinibacteria bacterium]MBT7337166.1 hypothetical protein [Candidatus Peregrinibacteria bacterium]
MTTNRPPEGVPDFTDLVDQYRDADQAKVKKTINDAMDRYRTSLTAAGTPTTPEAAPTRPRQTSSAGQEIANAGEAYANELARINREAQAEQVQHQSRMQGVEYTNRDNWGALAKVGATGTAIAGLDVALGSALLPAAGTVATASAAGLGAIGGAGAGALYGLGRLEGHLWNKRRAGFLKNAFVRGPLSAVTIPAWLLTKTGKTLWNSGSTAVQNNIEALPKMYKGESIIPKVLTAPAWWPVRSTWRIAKGVKQGWGGGDMTQSKGMGKIGNGIGKVAHSPIDAVKYLLSPANS